MNIAFCINRLALIGLGVTISSLIQNCSETSRLTLWFLCADLNETDKSNLKSLLSRERFKGKYNVIDFDSISNFGNLRSLHGDWTTYGRLLLPELLLEEDIVLYLDADLVIEFDVLEMGEVSLEDFPIGAASNSKVKYSIEKDFFINQCNLSPEDSYFNAGVLLINLSLWRGRGLKDKCLEFGKQYSDELIAADQTILNAMFNKSFKKLPKHCNCPWYADKEKPNVSEKMILHFVGSPKPWDIGGSVLHSGYNLWSKYLNDEWKDRYNSISLKDLRRTWKIRKSYGRLLKRILKMQ